MSAYTCAFCGHPNQVLVQETREDGTHVWMCPVSDMSECLGRRLRWDKRP